MSAHFEEIMPNDNHVTPDQMLVYKHRRVIQSIVTPRIKNVAKMPKLNPRINLGTSSDLGITNPRFIFKTSEYPLISE